MTHRERARSLAVEYTERGEPLAWFEPFYARAAGNAAAIPWADLTPHPGLREWLERGPSLPAGPALVVGCGLGDDAEELARRGMRVTAFDVSPTAVAWCRQRFPGSTVAYRVADACAPPAEWAGAFALVIEIYTLQVLPPEVRPVATAALAGCMTPGGTLLAIARARDADDGGGSTPWLFTRADLAAFETAGLVERSFEEYRDGETPPVRRFRAEFQRPLER